MFTCGYCGSTNVKVINFTAKSQHLVEYSCLCQEKNCEEYYYGNMFYDKLIDIINVLINRNNTLKAVRSLIEREENDQAELVNFVNNNDYKKEVF